MLFQHSKCDILDGLDVFVVANADSKRLAPDRITAVVAHGAFKHSRIWNLLIVDIKSDEIRSSGRQTLDVAGFSGDRHQVPRLKRSLNTQKNAGEEVLRNVPECDTNDQSHQARSSDHSRGQACQTGDMKHKVETQ